MSGKRLGMLSGLMLGLVLMIGVVQAGAQGSTTVLKFYDSAGHGHRGWIQREQPERDPAGRRRVVIALQLKNIGSQFGKPSGATVGRVLLDCTVLAVNTSAPVPLTVSAAGSPMSPTGFSPSAETVGSPMRR